MPGRQPGKKGNPDMAYITMWRVGDIQCVLVLDTGQRELRLMDGPAVIRRQMLAREANAAAIANEWHSGIPTSSVHG